MRKWFVLLLTTACADGGAAHDGGPPTPGKDAATCEPRRLSSSTTWMEPGDLQELAVDETHVYWTARESERGHPVDTAYLYRAPKGGGEAEVLLHGARATSLAVHDGSLWFLYEDRTSLALARMPTSGGAVEVIAPLDARRVLHDVASIWVGTGHDTTGWRLVEIGREGQHREVASFAFRPTPVVADASAVYVYTGNPPFGALHVLDRAGGSSRAVLEGHPVWLDVTQDDGALYFHELGVGLVRVDKDTGAATRIAEVERARAVLFDGGRILFITGRNRQVLASVTLGGAVETLHTGPDSISDLAADDDSLYWLEDPDSIPEVWALDKRCFATR